MEESHAGENDTEDFRISKIERIAAYLARLLCLPLVDFFFKVLNRSAAIGLQNLRGHARGVLIASNHISGVDTLMIPKYAIDRRSTLPFCAPAKEELFKIPVVGFVLRRWGAFPVKRRSRDFQSMKRIAYYTANYRVMIFPEGTRSKTGELLPGRSGVGWIIYRARPTVIPTLVINTEKFFWPGNKRPWFGIPYRVVFGEPLDLERFYGLPDEKETSQAIVDEIMKAIAALKEKHRGLYLS